MIRLFQRGTKQNLIDAARQVSERWRFVVAIEGRFAVEP